MAEIRSAEKVRISTVNTVIILYKTHTYQTQDAKTNVLHAPELFMNRLGQPYPPSSSYSPILHYER